MISFQCAILVIAFALIEFNLIHGQFVLDTQNCNNNGYFFAPQTIPSGFCVCSVGFRGTNCQFNVKNQVLIQCDCGVIWTMHTNVSIHSSRILSVLTITNTGPIIDSDTIWINSPNSDGAPVGFDKQAKYICYSTLQCDGFIMKHPTDSQMLASFFV